MNAKNDGRPGLRGSMTESVLITLRRFVMAGLQDRTSRDQARVLVAGHDPRVLYKRGRTGNPGPYSEADPRILSWADAIEQDDEPRPEDFAESLRLMTDRAEFVNFIEQVVPLEVREVDPTRVFAAAALVLACRRDPFNASGLLLVVDRLKALIDESLPDDEARHERAGEFAVAYLLGWKRETTGPYQGRVGLPITVDWLVQSFLRRSVEAWLRWCIAHVPKFHEAVFDEPRILREQHQSDVLDRAQELNLLFRNESSVWATRLHRRLTAVLGARCRCWTSTLGESQQGREPETFDPKSNAGGRYRTCKAWHHISGWNPTDGVTTFWLFLRRACHGFFDAFSAKEKTDTNRYKSLPSGLLWTLWNDPDEIDEHPGRELIVARVLRRLCPACKRYTFFDYCPVRNGRQEGCDTVDFTKIDPDIDGEWIVLKAGGTNRFNPRNYRVCKVCKAEGKPCVFPAEVGSKCPACESTFRGFARTVYVWMTDHGGTSGARRWLQPALREILKDLVECTSMFLIIKFFIDNNIDQWIRFLESDTDANWAELHDLLATCPDRPSTSDELRDRFRREILPLIAEAAREHLKSRESWGDQTDSDEGYEDFDG